MVFIYNIIVLDVEQPAVIIAMMYFLIHMFFYRYSQVFNSPYKNIMKLKLYNKQINGLFFLQNFIEIEWKPFCHMSG